MNVIWSPEALEDIEEAIDYLVERSPPAAERLATGILALVERLATEPLEGTQHVLDNGERVHGYPEPKDELIVAYDDDVIRTLDHESATDRSDDFPEWVL